MRASLERCLLCVLSVAWLGACTTPKRPAPRRPDAVTSTPAPPRAVIRRTPAKPAVESGLYTPQQALQDVMQGRWEYLGTGSWPGNNRTDACVFRNDKVFIVNVYCTVTETPAFRAEIFSPEHGRLRLYAEAERGVSRQTRPGYFTFMVESEPPPGPGAAVLPLELAMPLSELRLRESQRYDAFLPSCYSGVQHGRLQTGCLDSLAPKKAAFAEENALFVEQANNNWYQLVKILRRLAVRYGRDPR